MSLTAFLSKRLLSTAFGSHNVGQRRLAHRLDRNTTGVLLMAKTKEALSRLNYMFSQRAISKEYLTVVVGKPKAKSGHLRGLGTVQPDPAERLFIPQGAHSSHKRDSWGGSCDAKASYEVLRHSAKYDVSLLRLRPSTGYKHQLRIQCTELLNCPMLGDKRYHGDEFHPSLRPRLRLHGLGSDSHPHGVLLHLHAAKLIVPGYVGDGDDLVLEAPLPDHMRLTLAACGLSHPSIEDIEHHPQQQPGRGEGGDGKGSTSSRPQRSEGREDDGSSSRRPQQPGRGEWREGKGSTSHRPHRGEEREDDGSSSRRPQQPGRGEWREGKGSTSHRPHRGEEREDDGSSSRRPQQPVRRDEWREGKDSTLRRSQKPGRASKDSTADNY